MIYVSISDTILEVLSSSDNILGKETVVSVARKEIPAGVIIGGMVNDYQKLLAVLKDALTNAYPRPIQGKEISIVTTDNYDLEKRFEINSQSADPAKEVIETVKKLNSADPTELENFYQILESDKTSSKVFYAAMSKNAILNLNGFVKSAGYKLSFLTYQSIAGYSLLKNMLGETERVLYAQIEKEIISFSVYDKFGFAAGYRKKPVVSFKDSLNDVLKDLKSKNLSLSKLFIGGSGSLDIHENDLAGLTGFNLVKMSEVMDEILAKNKIELDTGGIPKMLFCGSLALFLFSKSSHPANFIMDFETEKTESTSSVSDPGSKKTIPLKLIAAILGLIILIAGFVLLINNKSALNLPSLATPTPTLTQVPTVTPTPTIDVSLKRGDLKISVANGTQKSGYAKEIGIYLEGKGYKNTDKTNADKSDYETSVIRIKDNKKNYLPLLSSDLNQKVDISTVETLDETSPFDVVLVLGNK